ncbi:MAG: GtrA family protein [Desulfovibrio sp.]|nr:GtrA family protein [Desulfovibrio sp.]
MTISFWVKKNRELIAYGIFGVLTTLINYIVYAICLELLHYSYLTSNTIAWIIAVLFAFITNKHYVFRSLNWDFSTAFRECWQFVSARIFSLILESILLWICIDCFHINELITKIFTNALVILVNYLISKLYIFK